MANKVRYFSKGLSSKGQSATEVLVVLAVVLIIAMVSISLLSEGLDSAGGVKESQSRAYWSSQSPISILDWAAGEGNLTLRVRNSGNYPIKITHLLGNGASAALASQISIAAGEEATISGINYSRLNPASACIESGKSSGTLVIYSFGLRYDQSIGSGGAASIIEKTQQAGKAMPLVINCFTPDMAITCGDQTCGGLQECCLDEVCRDSCFTCNGIYCQQGYRCCPDNVCRDVSVSCGEACGGATCFSGFKCCSTPNFHCINSTWTCNACGGCSPTQQCCPAAGNICISNSLTCDACGGACTGGQVCYNGACRVRCGTSNYCDPSTQQCCANAGNICIPNGWVCDACGGACAAWQVCHNGVCSVACGANYCGPGTNCCSDKTCRISCEGTVCGGGPTCYPSEGEACCEAIPKRPYCAQPPKLPCDACGGTCTPDEFCCTEGKLSVCKSASDKCNDACGAAGLFCDYKTQKCCDALKVPACIPKERACDVCGGCDPNVGACCPDKMICTANGEPCKDGSIACYGSLCDEKTQECCKISKSCVAKGACK